MVAGEAKLVDQVRACCAPPMPGRRASGVSCLYRLRRLSRLS